MLVWVVGEGRLESAPCASNVGAYVNENDGRSVSTDSRNGEEIERGGSHHRGR